MYAQKNTTYELGGHMQAAKNIPNQTLDSFSNQWDYKISNGMISNFMLNNRVVVEQNSQITTTTRYSIVLKLYAISNDLVRIIRQRTGRKIII